MTAMTARTNLETRPRTGRTSFDLDDSGSITVFAGGLCGIVTASGLIVPWNNVATTQFLGLALETRTSTSTAILNTAVPVDTEGPIIRRIPIGSAVAASVGEPVFCTTDNIATDAVLTATSRAIGVILKVRSASDCDIRLFTPTEWRAHSSGAAITLLTDSTGGTANNTLAVIDDTIAVVGGDGMSTAQETEYNLTMGVIADNFADLAAKVNEILGT